MQRELFKKKQCKNKGDKHITHTEKKWAGEKEHAASLPGEKKKEKKERVLQSQADASVRHEKLFQQNFSTGTPVSGSLFLSTCSRTSTCII